MRPKRHRYGRHPSQWAEALRPPGPGPHPVAVLIHGGFWAQRHGAALQRPVARDLVARGWATWNLEYRRLEAGGGWPATLEDVAAGIDAIAGADNLDPSRVLAVGHSAGGQLALWAAARPGLPEGAPGARPQVRLRAVAAQAPLADLEAAARGGLARDAVRALLGGTPEEVPERYALASPARRLPLGVPLLLVHGEADRMLPVDGTERFAEAARAAGDACEVVRVDGEEHTEHLDPGTGSWRAVASRLGALLEAQAAVTTRSRPARLAR